VTQEPGILIVGTMEVDPSDRAAFAEICRRTMTQTRGREGNTHYSFNQDLFNENLFHLSEGWRDEVALQDHFARADFQQCLRDLSKLSVSSRRVKLYTVSEVCEVPTPSATDA